MSVAAVATLRGLLRKAKLAAGAGAGDSPSDASCGGGRPTDDDSLEPVPAVGFRARTQAAKLAVTVLGARHLPARLPAIGSPASGYIVKVKLFPGTAKFETEQQPESWPTFNESFSFPLGTTPLTGRFLMLTVYAVDELRRRKAIGAVTWSLDALQKQQQSHAPAPDIWRRLHDVRGEILPTTLKNQWQLQKEARRNQVEVSLQVKPGSVGEADSLVMKVHMLRWSLQSTREHEQKKAQLYVKLSVREGSSGAPIKSQKSRSFAPNITVHFNAEDEATLQAPLPPQGPRRDALVCQVSLCTRQNRIAKKVVLGRAVFGTTEIAEKSEGTVPGHVAKALHASMGTVVTQWHSLI